MNVRDFSIDETLRDGTSVTIRAVRPEDAERLVKAFEELDRESVYTRFFSYRNAPTPEELARFRAIDFARDVMLVATTGAGESETVIASARYAIIDATGGKTTAEVAFVVEEDYQGRGLGARLLSHLVTIARDQGIARFCAEVLPGNKAMRAVFARAGLPTRQHSEDGVVHLDIDLSPVDRR